MVLRQGASRVTALAERQSWPLRLRTARPATPGGRGVVGEEGTYSVAPPEQGGGHPSPLCPAVDPQLQRATLAR
jgi:hypothetical protein